MAYQSPPHATDVTVEVGDGVAVITIDRPSSRNAIALATIQDLSASLDALEQRNDVSVVVIRGAGTRAFISGGDLKNLADIKDLSGAADMARTMRRLLDRLSNLSVPVIAALNGSAMGGGAEVAVAADIRVAADDIEISFAQARLAILPAWGGAERLAELVGRSRAMELIGTARSISATTAAEYGLIELVASRAEFEHTWQSLARAFAQLPVELVESIKRMVGAIRPNHHPHVEATAVSLFARAWVSDAHWSAVAQTERPKPGVAPEKGE